MKSFFLFGCRYVLLILVLIAAQSGVCGEKDPVADSLRRQLELAASDTAKVNILFGLGNRFIDGPSDSLLYYYTAALQMIDSNLVILSDDADPENLIVYKTFKSLKMRALIELGIEYFFRNEYDKALDYYFKAAGVAREIGDRENLSECYSEIGIVYKNQGKLDLALNYQQQALDIALSLSDEDWIAICNTNIGNIYKEKGFLTIAQDYYIKALRTFEKLNRQRRMAALYHSMGDMYFEQENFDVALEYFNKSLTLSRIDKDRLREADLYLSIGNIHAVTGDPVLARNYFFRAEALYDTLGYRFNLDEVYHSVGLTWLTAKQPDNALRYFKKALRLSQEKNDNTTCAEILGAISRAYLMKNNLTTALEYARKSLEAANLSGAPKIKMNAYENLYRVREKMNDPDGALKYYKLYSVMKDSVFRADQYRAITEMDIKYQTRKKEQNIALLTEKNKVQELIIERHNRLKIILIILFLLAVVIGYSVIVYVRLKARHKAIELENRLLRSQMNPHFIFNALIAIQSYIYKKDPVTAGDYLSKFADLVRITLENSRVEFVLLQKELKMLELYLQLQILRFDDKFGFVIENDGDTDPDNIKIPPMLTQPFIENAVEHGLRLKEGRGNIIVKYRQRQNEIEFTIEDNGVGRAFAAKHEKARHSQSMATTITRERLDILSKKMKRKFILQVIDLKNKDGSAAGTKVIITMPYLKNI